MEKKKDQYKIAVLGAGSWGITLGNVLYQNGNPVVLWEFDKKQAKKLEAERSFRTLGNYRIPENIVITSSLKEAVHTSDIIILAVPSSALSYVAGRLSRYSASKDTVFVSAVKGFDQKTLKRPSEVLRASLGKNAQISVLSGPSHAEEVIREIPTAVVISSVKKDLNLMLQNIFSNVYLRVYTSLDIKGVELGGALKNIIAVASGIASGLGLGDNTRAALITRGNSEIMRLGVKMGAKRITFSGLSGIGDLIVTCFSEHSRNYRFGKLIGKGVNFEDAQRKIGTTVEGAYTVKSCMKLAEQYEVQMPVCSAVFQMLYKGTPAVKAQRELMLRPLKSEDFYKN
jgi:glycerol-3-phosphate dehydrogenase (NAD(P)+)